MTTQPAGRAAADQAAGDSAALVPTPTPAAGHVTAGHVTAGHVTAGEIGQFLRDLAELRVGARGDDPAERAAFLTRKAALFARIPDPHTRPATGPAATQPASTQPEGRTP